LKVARFEVDGKQSYGVLEGTRLKAIKGLPWDGIDFTGEDYELDAVQLLAPVDPPDVIAIGTNYKAHADELGWKHPSAPIIFLKATSSVIGPEADIVIPTMAPDEVDYEGELVLVIGKTCRNVSEADALDYVFGSTCGNDVSARDCQMRQDAQWTRGKSFDTFCPIGPWIETDVDPDNAPIKLRLNGKTLQDSNTNDMIFNCRQLVSYCSQMATMKPGTIIMTGTPEGVGYTRKPPVFLKPGDRIEVEIGGIGTLANGIRG
jgi:2-keto-4-pentenoate hydratase/2-oxohepta-3-ene-1,7-dioic acid hydratase in catechol pathway